MISHAKIFRHRRMFKTLTDLSATCEGKKHDKKLADEQALRFPKGSKLWKDTDFQGYEPAGVTTLQAKKEPKGGQTQPRREGGQSACLQATGARRAQ